MTRNTQHPPKDSHPKTTHHQTAHSIPRPRRLSHLLQNNPHHHIPRLAKKNPQILFVAIAIWPERTFLVVDIHHHTYDFNTAHKATTIFPVYVLRQARKRSGSGWALLRWPQEDENINTRLAHLHDSMGYEAEMPFLQDHHFRRVHLDLRTLLDTHGVSMSKSGETL